MMAAACSGDWPGVVLVLGFLLFFLGLAWVESR
jgi:hypothetical protein